MILLISASPAAQRCALLLEQRLEQRVEVAESLRRARALIKRDEHAVVLLDQSSIDSDALAIEELIVSSTATVLAVNLAIHDAERVLRETILALRRRERERDIARQQAEAKLRSRLKDELTGILLSSEMALHTPELPQIAQARIQQVYEAGRRMRELLNS